MRHPPAYRASLGKTGDGNVEPSVCGKPIVAVARGGVVQDVFNLPPGTLYEIRDYAGQLAIRS